MENRTCIWEGKLVSYENMAASDKVLSEIEKYKNMGIEVLDFHDFTKHVNSVKFPFIAIMLKSGDVISVVDLYNDTTKIFDNNESDKIIQDYWLGIYYEYIPLIEEEIGEFKVS